MKFTTTVFPLLALTAGVFAAPDNNTSLIRSNVATQQALLLLPPLNLTYNGPSNFTPPFNATPGFVSGRTAGPKESGEDVSDAAAPRNDTMTCNRYVPFPFHHGRPHFGPGCSPVSIPHDAAPSISSSYAALAAGIAAVVFSL
ncbi:hypothetical protein CHU98_g2232 [Xylaria longipes]|nr:hypothetical protein CHU98_g2232 [Xylaria longipes]